MPLAHGLKYSGEFPSRFREVLRLHYRYRVARFVLSLVEFFFLILFFSHQSFLTLPFRNLEVNALIADMSKVLKSILKKTSTLPEWKEADEVCRNVWLGT